MSALTSREAALALQSLIAHGRSHLLRAAAVPARHCWVSLHTVASHIKNAYRKLGVRSAAAAVMRAIELQLL